MFEKSGIFYDAMYVVGMILMMVFSLNTHKRFGIKKRDAVLYTIYSYICGISGALLMGWLYNQINHALGFESSSAVAIFGAVVFTPFFMLAFPKVYQNWANIMDMLAPCGFVILTCAKFGCFINGCCYGVLSNFGIHYTNTDGKRFPVQLFEVLSMLLVLFLTQVYFRKTKHFVSGTAYPITFGCYSAVRFFWEFFRYYSTEQRHALFGLTIWQNICCVIFVVCAVITLVLYRKARIAQKEDPSNS